MLYTGGTTGMPKGVMWRQDDLFRTSSAHDEPRLRDGEADDERGAARSSTTRARRRCPPAR